MNVFKQLFTFLALLSLPFSHGAKLKKISAGAGGAICVSGKYLYAVLDDKLCTYDISRPTEPQLCHQTAAAGNRQLVKGKNCLFLSCRANGVQVFSLQNPAAPQEINRFYPAELATGLTISQNVLAVTLRIYGVEFFDISDPRKVRSLGLLRGGEAQSAAFFGDGKIAIGDWAKHRVLIGDVKNLARSKLISSCILDGAGDGIFISGKYLYAATGYDAAPTTKNRAGRGHGLEIFDISDITAPVRTGTVKFAVYPNPFPDWWSVTVANDTAFVADTRNGVYVVDVKDKKQPKILTRIRLKRDSASQLALGDKVVYVSGHRSGLYLFQDPRAAIVPPEKSDIALPAVSPEIPSIPKLSNIPQNGFVWSLAKYDNKLYAACGGAGISVFSISADGTLHGEKQQFPGVAMDCAVSGKLLIAAADMQLNIFDRTSGELISSTPSPDGTAFLQLRLYGDVLCTNGRTSKLYMWDISDPAKPQLKAKYSGGGLLYGDMLPERAVNGMFPVNWHSRHLRWYNGSFQEYASLPELHRRSQQRNGITEINGKFLLIGKKEIFILDPYEPANFTPIPLPPKCSGIPASDGQIIAVSNRGKGEISFYHFDGRSVVPIPDRKINMPFAVTGRVVFHNRKVYIPAGNCGIYFEK